MIFTRETYKKRRNRLMELFGSGLIVINGNDLSPMNYKHNVYPFIQDSTFLYYFGIEKEGLIGIIDCDNNTDYLIGHNPSIDDIIWEGPVPSLRDYSDRIGTDKTIEIDHLGSFLKENLERIKVLPQYRGDNQIKLANLLGINIDSLDNYVDEKLLYAIASMRNYKSDEEVELLEEACRFGVEMHLEALKVCKPGRFEYEIESAIRAVATSHDGHLSFPSIVSVNGQTLHNPYYKGLLEDGKLLLVDAGIRHSNGYCSDMTSTIPVSGKFTDKQKDLYNLLIEMYDGAVKLLKPGISYKEVHLETCKILAEGLVKRGFLRGSIDEIVKNGAHALFMPHGLGHMIGLDVHDMENFGEKIVGYNGEEKSKDFGLSNLRLGRELEKGFVITVEPGIYFIPELIRKWQVEGINKDFIIFDKVFEYINFGGMRYENDFLITERGSYQIGGKRPKTAEEIEKFMEERN